MNQFPPNTNPEIFSISAMVVGLIIEDDFNASELNAIGNWLILVGQITLTTAAQQQLIDNRFQNNTGSRIRSNANDHSLNNRPLATVDDLQALYQQLSSENANREN